MKEYLKDLQLKNKHYFDFIIFLWLSSDDKGIATFRISEACNNFNFSKTSLYRFLDEIERFEVTKLDKGIRTIKFDEIQQVKPVVKTVKKVEENYSIIEFNGRLRKFLREFYEKHDFHYPELEKHFKFALNIMSKMDGLIKLKNEVITEEIRFDSFCIFFEKLPIWWIENRKLSLATLNKNFTNILNQIKSSQNADKYSSLQQGAESIDFSGLTN